MNALPSPIPLDNEGHSVPRSRKRRKTPQNPKEISALPSGPGCTDVCRAENTTADTQGCWEPSHRRAHGQTGTPRRARCRGDRGAAAPQSGPSNQAQSLPTPAAAATPLRVTGEQPCPTHCRDCACSASQGPAHTPGAQGTGHRAQGTGPLQLLRVPPCTALLSEGGSLS